MPRPHAGHVTDLRRRGGKGADMTTATNTSTRTRTASKTGTVLAATLLGALFIYVVGFAPSAAMHNYAHDTRHSITAPCH